MTISEDQTEVINITLTQGQSQLPDFPLTIEAESMSGPADMTASGRNLTSQNWYIFTDPWVYFPEAGWIEIEVIAQAGGQVNSEWPKLELKIASSTPAQEIASTEWQSYYFLREITSPSDKSVEIIISESTRSTAGHSVIVDKMILRYTTAPENPELTVNTPLNIGSASSGLLSGDINITNSGTGTLTGNLTTVGQISVTPTTINLATSENSVHTVSVDVTGFQVGVYSDTVFVFTNDKDDTVEVIYTVEEPPAGSANLLTNGNFETGSIDPWYFLDIDNVCTESIISSDVHEGSYAFTATFSGTPSASWRCQLKQENISLTANQPLTFSFAVKAAANRPLTIEIEAQNSPYTEYLLESISVPTTWTTYSYDFTPNQADLIRVVFYFGDDTPQIWIDNVMLTDESSPPANQAPVAVDDNATTDQDVAVNIDVPANDSDPDGWLDLTTVIIVTQPSNGTTSVNSSTGVVTYTPNTGFTDTDSFTYTIKDDQGATSNEATVTITVQDTSAPNDYTDDPNNLFVNGTANDSVFAGWPGFDNWAASDRVSYTDNALYGPYSIQVEQTQTQTNADGTNLLQTVTLDQTKTYEVYVLLDNSADITGSISMTNYEYQGSWGWQNLWIDLTLQPDRQLMYGVFSPNISGQVVMQVQFGWMTGLSRVDSLIVKEQGLGKRSFANNESAIQIPTEYALHQNFPNPFNPETKIRFDIPEPTAVKLEIYNILGQKIKTLVNRPLSAGQHFVIWNGRNDFGREVSSGIYIYKLQAGEFVDIKKMFFLK